MVRSRRFLSAAGLLPLLSLAAPASAQLDRIPAWQKDGLGAGDRFGLLVAGGGDVNGDGFDDLIVVAADRIVAYHGSVAGPAETVSWTFASPATAGLPSGVALVGDLDRDGFDELVVVYPWGGEPEASEGRALLFRGSSGGLSASPDWSFQPGYARALLSSAAAAGDVNDDGYEDLVLGAPSDFNWLDPPSGRVFVFHGGPAGPGAAPDWTYESELADDLLGYSVAGAGDVDGDGVDDLAVGAPGYWLPGFPSVARGRVLVFHGASSGLGAGPNRVLLAPGARTTVGESLSGGGDSNGDGFDDLATGGLVFKGDDTEPCGSAHVFLGGPTGLAEAPAWSLQTPPFSGDLDERDSVGRYLAWLGDVQDDGLDELAIGAPTASSWPGILDPDVAGRVQVFDGTPSGPAAMTDWFLRGSQPGDPIDWGGDGWNADFGQVARAGDVNGDGLPDLIVAAQAHRSRGLADVGEVQVHFATAPPCGEPSAVDLDPSVEALRVAKRTGDRLHFSWQDIGLTEHVLLRAPVGAEALDLEILLCTGPEVELDLAPDSGSWAYALTGRCAGRLGSAGRSSRGGERGLPPDLTCP